MNADEEARRLDRLHRLRVLDTPPEPLFDHLVRLAAQLCGTPIALLSLVDADRQWFKAQVGLPDCEGTPREWAFCSHTIEQLGLLEVPDARQDARFADNPLVTGSPGVVHYAGVPLNMPAGERVGTLCVIGRRPARLRSSQRERLTELAGAVVQALLMREHLLAQHEAGEARFRSMTDDLPLGVFRCGADGSNSYVNEAWARIHGVPRSQGLGLSWRARLLDETRMPVASIALPDGSAEQAFESTGQVVRADGSRRYVQVIAQPLRDALGSADGLVGVVLDRTEAEQLKRERVSAEAQLRHAADLAGVGAWRFELGPPARLHWSDQTARIHDRAAGYQSGLDEAFDYYPPEAQALLRPAFERAMQDGSRFELELPMVTATGRRIWVQAVGEGVVEGGQVRRLLGAFRDVTQQREREQSLQLLLRRQQALYEESPALLLALDAKGGILATSTALLQRLGRSRAELAAGARLADWCTAESSQALHRHVLPLLFEHGRVERLSLSLQGAGDRLVELLFSAQRESDERAQAVLEDVTEQRVAAREMRREQALRLQLQAHAHDLRQLLDERNEMLGVLAHEVRQPLNNASAALQAALRALQADSTEAQAVQRAQRVLGQVQVGVDNNLAAAELLGRGGEPVLEDVELDLLIGIALGDLPAAERERVRLQRDSSTRTVRADLGLFRLALRNLLLNALAWSPPSAEVGLRLLDSDDPLAVFVDVIDRGPGIDPALLPRLFQRGARGRGLAGQRSHGLGLYIVRAAMERMGGQALLLYTGAQGTTMRLQLPL